MFNHLRKSLLCTSLVTAVAALPPTISAQAGTTRPTALECAQILLETNHANMDHAAHGAKMAECRESTVRTVPHSAGQAAFAVLSEVTLLLEADSATDWSRVNLEALRAHLIDMDEVTMKSRAVQQNVPGGVEIAVTGTGSTVGSITRMVTNHGHALDAMPQYQATTAPIANGVRLTVLAENAKDDLLITKIRGLGFAGLLTLGDHHAAHHLAIARGDAIHSH